MEKLFLLTLQITNRKRGPGEQRKNSVKILSGAAAGEEISGGFHSIEARKL
jgi:hypothetical protein